MLAHALGPHADKAYAAMRMVVALMFSFHGMQKILHVLPEVPPPTFGTLVWFAGLIELGCGLLVFVGLFTRLAAFLASGEMAAAYFIGHAHWTFDAKFLPPLNGGELAVTYCFVFLFIACQGSGRCALDRLCGRTASHA